MAVARVIRLFLQRHLGVVYSDVASLRSLQHYCVVLCHGVVAGPAPSCGSLPQHGLLFPRTGFSAVSLSLCFMSFSCRFRTLLLFTCPDDSSLCLVLHAGVPTLLNSAVFRLHSCSCFFSFTWPCASWSAGTPRVRHVRKDRPVYMSGGAFLLSFSLVLHARLASSRLFIVDPGSLSALRLCPSSL